MAAAAPRGARSGVGGEAARATLGTLRLAWAADRRGLVLVALVSATTTAADVSQPAAGGRAVDAVLAGGRRADQARRVTLAGGAYAELFELQARAYR